MLSFSLIFWLLFASVCVRADGLQAHRALVNGPESIAVRETITVRASEGELIASADPVVVEFERSSDGRMRWSVRGFNVFVDEQDLLIIHESNNEAFVRVAHEGKPRARIRQLFAETPSLWLALACSKPSDDVLGAFLVVAPGLHSVESSNGSRTRLQSDHATGWFEGVLPGRMSVEVTAGPWVAEGSTLTWEFSSERADLKGTSFDPNGRRRLDQIAALPRRVPAGVMGEAAGVLELPLASGGNFALSEHLGKVVILDFWASWCGPCRRALPTLSRFAERVAEREMPVEVVTVNTSERERDPVRRATFVLEERKNIGFDLPILIDLDGSVASEWGVSALPTTIIIAPDGTVASVHRGAGAEYESMLEAEVEALLKPEK